MKRIVLLFTCLVALLLSHGQQFGGFPPSTKWKQIDSDTARIIFMAGAERQAARVASIIRQLALDTPQSLGPRVRKINTVLQSRTTLANGYVALGPWRSEYYLVPSSNLFEMGNLPWADQLAIHEYRHVHQYNNFNNGITKGFYFLFGEQGRAFANAITIPDWFFEGDAVHAETALTPSGRGQLGLFNSGFTSIWLEGKNYNWQKLRNRSMKDYVPDHYQLGYLLTNYGYAKYGDAFWKNVTQDASRFKGVFYPFQRAVKKHAGVNFKQFRKEAFDYYRQRLDTGSHDGAQHDNRTVTDYFFPQMIGRDSLLYMKKGYNAVPAFYILHNGAEKKLRQRSISYEDWFTYRNGTIAYTAYSTHPRWSAVDYSDIVLLDIASGKERRVTKKARYYTPDISPSGSKIVAVRISDSLESTLVLMDLEGKIVKEWQDETRLFVHPGFVDEHTVVVGRRSEDARISMELLNTETGTTETLMAPTTATIGHPFANKEKVYFTAGFAGNDNLYALQPSTKKLHQLTATATGNYFPSVYGDSITWTRFTANGMEWRKAALKEMDWKEVSVQKTNQSSTFPVALASNMMDDIRKERWRTRRYNKGTALLNFHSWAPSYGRPESSFSLYSDNILNTFSNQLYYRHNSNEKWNAVGWNTSYSGFFTRLNAGAEYIFGRRVLTTAGEAHYDQYELRAGYDIPLNFTKGRTYKFLNFGTNIVYSAAQPKSASRQIIRGASSGYLHHFITASQYKPAALQHIFPKFGYAVSLQHRHRLDEGGSQFLASANIYLPSFGNHGIVLQASLQETDTSNVLFTNRFNYPRGYEAYLFAHMWRLGANYHFPIVYPDLGFGSIVYFRRIRGNLFYDYTKLYSNDRSASRRLTSTGFEIFFDTKWWNQQEVSFGIRFSHLLDKGFRTGEKPGTNRIAFILPLDLIPD